MSDSVQSIARAFSIMEAISENKNSISITDLSKVVNLHKSTVHRILNTLIQQGYVKKNPKNNYYELSFKLLELSASVIAQNDLKSILHPYLEQLSDISGEVVHLVVQDGTDIIYIDKVESTHTLRMHSYIGRRSPMYCTAVGKAILANQSNHQIMSYWQNIQPVKFTEHTIVDLETFFDEITTIRIHGFSYDNEEQEPGIKCIAISLLDYNGETVGALSISAPISRMTEDKIKLLQPELLKIKDAVSKKLNRI